ncbi:hypothetical protein A9Q99_11085 [Gammaproteobacteria bacterium 45_16_T64]|nr:hypothetical protein A9Q99_11085 [Gammaproteobacteria bacterium 45_16_T64]
MELSRILIVDDSELNQSFIKGLLEGGYEVIAVDSAEACLSLLSEWQPDIFLLDVNMPGMGGIDLCKELKAMPELESSPVIFVSSLNNADDRLDGYEAGGDDYMGRPFSSWELLKKIELAITHKKSIEAFQKKSEAAAGAAMTAMTAAGEIGHVLHFFRESFSTISFSDLADKLIDVVNYYGVNAIVEIKTDLERVQRTFRGSELSANEQKVMDSLRGVKNIHDFGGRTAFNYHYISLIAMNMPCDDPDKKGRVRDHVAMLVEGANSRAEMIVMEQQAEFQRNMVSDAVNIATVSLANIELQQNENQAELTAIMNSLVEDVSKAFFTMGLTEDQEEDVMTLINTAESKTNALFEKNEGLGKDLKAVTFMLGVNKTNI